MHPTSVEAPLTVSQEELLESGAYAEPLIANGVRCHGGFDADGRYRSPRTLHRGPAIAAWQARLAREGAPLVTLDKALMPPQYPNVEQAKLLLRNGVRDPIVRTLTTIAIVEGFGAIIRDVQVPDLGALVVEPVDGTSLAHLRRGLFEAHARDESGWREEGGHKQMWEAARDLAFEKPKVPGDVLTRMMGRGGRVVIRLSSMRCSTRSTIVRPAIVRPSTVRSVRARSSESAVRRYSTCGLSSERT